MSLSLAQLHALAKTELHCHLDGSISLPTIRQLAEMAGITVPKHDDELAALAHAPADATDLMAYLKAFDFVRPLLQTKEALSLAAYDVCAQAAAENVRYIEIRFAPELSMDRGLSITDTVDAVVEGLRRAMADFDLTATAIICGMRQSAAAVNDAVFKAVAPMMQNSLVGGGDFAGNEAAFPPSVLADSIRKAQAAGVPMTLHAGECHCVQNVVDAIELGITRLGHATAVFDQPEVIAQMVANNVTAELCLTSNLQTKAATDLSQFPYRALQHAGAKITINTDNRTVSNTDLTHEYALFQQYFEVTAEDFLAFNHNAVAAGFIDDATKKQLHERLEKDYEPFLAH